MICSYCKTENSDKNTKYCSYCEVELNRHRPVKKQLLSVEDAYLTFYELVEYHTYDLLLLLRHVRAERTNYYKIMQNVRKAPASVKKEKDNFDELNEYGQKLYREHTAQKHLIEQILVDRMGYFPSRIDDKMLEKYYQKIAD